MCPEKKSQNFEVWYRYYHPRQLADELGVWLEKPKIYSTGTQCAERFPRRTHTFPATKPAHQSPANSSIQPLEDSGHVKLSRQIWTPLFLFPKVRIFYIWTPQSKYFKNVWTPLEIFEPRRLDHFHARSWLKATRLWHNQVTTKTHGPKGNFCRGCCIFTGSVLETFNLQCELRVAKSVTELWLMLACLTKINNEHCC